MIGGIPPDSWEFRHPVLNILAVAATLVVMGSLAIWWLWH